MRIPLLAVLALLAGCFRETGPGKAGDAANNLEWTARYGCGDSGLYGIYRGKLKINGLEEGERVRVYLGDSLAVDTLSGATELMIAGLAASDYRLPPVTVVYRSDSLRLSSGDSVLATYFPFPIRFSLIAENTAGGGNASSSKTYCLLASDSGCPRIRCRWNDSGDFDILPDTLRFNATRLYMDLEADAIGNRQELWVSYVDTSNTVKVPFTYEAVSASNELPLKNTLRRNRSNFKVDIPSLPAQVSLSLGSTAFPVRIEKE